MNIQKPSASQLTRWRKLRQKKYRREYGLFLAEGERCVEQILENGYLKVDALLRSSATGWVPGETPAARPELYELDETEFSKFSDTSTPQGVAAICRIPDEMPAVELAEKRGVIIAADAIQDPGNLGTMIRTAAWFEAAGFIYGSGTVDPWHPKVVRSTAGATGVLPVAGGPLDALLRQLEEKGWRVVLLVGGTGATPLQDIARVVGTENPGTILVVGNEANGVSPELFSEGRKKVKIEGNPAVVESLNAALAMGIALYELSRSRP